jgi:2-iminoacetate synthase
MTGELDEMSFTSHLDALPMEVLIERSLNSCSAAVVESMTKPRLSLLDFAHLISPVATNFLEQLGVCSSHITRQRFGKVMRLFAPLYLSNECINNCKYCGFSRDNPILRLTLTVEELRREAQALVDQGFRNILLVAGEHPKFVSTGYTTLRSIR